MIKIFAELKSVVDKWVGNLHLDPNIPHDIAVLMCEEFIAFLKKDKQEKIDAQAANQQVKVDVPVIDEVKNG